METLKFLKTILPPSGIYYLVTIREYTNRAGELKTKTDHHPFEHLAAMADAIEYYDTNPKPGQLGVYHACAAYKQESIHAGEWPNGDPKLSYRVPENHGSAKALWVDLDCGEDKAAEGKGYATKNDAAKALGAFCVSAGIPAPMVVDSGGGLHCYWPFTKPVNHAAWKKLATAFKALTQKFGFLADPTRTADFASILRPAGTHNTKRGGRREVRVCNAGKFREVTPEEIVAAIARVKREQGLEVPKHIERQAVASDLDDLISKGKTDFPPYSAEEAATKCAQIAAMRDTKGDVGYDHWRGVIGFIKFSSEGEQLAFEWSSEREATGHSQCDVQSKLDSWNSKPPTCEFFQGCNPDGCEGCEWKEKLGDKLKSPARLGRTITIHTETEVQTVEERGKKVEVEIPPMPRGYRWHGNQIVRELLDKDGLPQDHAVTPTRLWSVARVRGTDGRMKVLLRMLMDDGRVKDFYVGADEIAAGGTSLLKALGAYEVYPSTQNINSANHLTAYLRDEAEALKRRAQEVNTYESFGWKDDYEAFVIGNRAYTKDGAERLVITAGSASSYEEALTKRTGSAEGWARAIDVLYNREGMEAYQYALCSGFGSPLGEFQEEEYKGIPVALTSKVPGKGKSTLCKMALYAFGNAEEMTLTGDKGATPMARDTFMGTYKNLPILIDEITYIKPEELGDFLYTASNGKAKTRLQSTGGAVSIRKPLTWNTSVYLTANTRMAALLSSVKADSMAEAVRIFEIPLDSMDTPELDLEEFKLAVGTVKRNVGLAGETYLKWLAQNQSKILEMIVEEAKALNGSVVETPQFRFFRMHVECTMVAARIMKELGLVEFDIDRMRAWAHNHVKYLCGEAFENNTMSPEDGLHAMLSQLSPDILVTYQYRNGTQRAESPTHKPRGEVIGRYMLGDDTHKDLAGRLYLSKKAVRDWCLKNRMDVHSLELVMRECNALIEIKEDRIRLTRGTDMPAVQARCYAIDTRKLPGAEVPLTLVKQEDAA